MCGICGRVGGGRRDVVERMNARLRHRGPDHEGTFFADDALLAMRRLAILDVEGGRQPIFSEDEQVVAIHNGEIYNFAELRDELIARGHRFRSTTDSEVLVHGYEEWGRDLIPRLEGMFCSCIWDRRRRRMLLARDRFGEKPLFFHASVDGALSFSSELASLMEDGAISRAADHAALGLYLRMGFIPEPLTAFRDVRSLAPGHCLEWQDGRFEIRSYASPSYEVDPQFEDDEAAEDACIAALESAVKRQMVSDVPLGAFLSGGIDSSTVVATMQRMSARPVKTFTVRFEDQSYDESRLASRIAQHLGTEHHELVVPNAAFSTEDLWRIVDHVGQPFYDSSAIPTYLLCREVREHVTVALTGDGGDEMFAGYPFFRWARAIAELTRLPNTLLRAGARAARGLAAVPALQGRSALRQARRAFDAAAGSRAAVPARVLSIFDDAELEALLEDAPMLAAVGGDLDAMTVLPAEAARWTPLRRLMYYRIRNNLPGDMLTKIDRMSMACSLELRAPMLDVGVARFASRLPDAQLRRNGQGKDILRRAMRKYLPAEVFEAPKSGFSIPLHHYWNESFHSLATQLLSPSGPIAELVDRSEVDRMRAVARGTHGDGAQQSVYRASHQLWSVVMMAAWAQRFEVIW